MFTGIDREEAEETDEEEKPEHLSEAVTVLGTLSGTARTEAFIVRESKSVRSVRCHNMLLPDPAWSTLIGRGMSRLIVLKYFHADAMPALMSC